MLVQRVMQVDATPVAPLIVRHRRRTEHHRYSVGREYPADANAGRQGGSRQNHRKKLAERPLYAVHSGNAGWAT